MFSYGETLNLGAFRMLILGTRQEFSETNTQVPTLITHLYILLTINREPYEDKTGMFCLNMYICFVGLFLGSIKVFLKIYEQFGNTILKFY